MSFIRHVVIILPLYRYDRLTLKPRTVHEIVAGCHFVVQFADIKSAERAIILMHVRYHGSVAMLCVLHANGRRFKS